MSSSESPTTGTAQIGVTGLAVMGSNLARNFANHGYTVALHNRSVAKTDALLAEHGIGWQRTILGGFSMGCVMSYATGLGPGRPSPAGILAISGFIPTVEGWEADLEPPSPPIAIAHGSYDPVIPVEFGRDARARLESAGADVLYLESPIEHSIDPQTILQLRALVL